MWWSPLSQSTAWIRAHRDGPRCVISTGQIEHDKKQRETTRDVSLPRRGRLRGGGRVSKSTRASCGAEGATGRPLGRGGQCQPHCSASQLMSTEFPAACEGASRATRSLGRARGRCIFRRGGGVPQMGHHNLSLRGPLTLVLRRRAAVLGRPDDGGLAVAGIRADVAGRGRLARYAPREEEGRDGGEKVPGHGLRGASGRREGGLGCSCKVFPQSNGCPREWGKDAGREGRRASEETGFCSRGGWACRVIFELDAPSRHFPFSSAIPSPRAPSQGPMASPLRGLLAAACLTVAAAQVVLPPSNVTGAAGERYPEEPHWCNKDIARPRCVHRPLPSALAPHSESIIGLDADDGSCGRDSPLGSAGTAAKRGVASHHRDVHLPLRTSIPPSQATTHSPSRGRTPETAGPSHTQVRRSMVVVAAHQP